MKILTLTALVMLALISNFAVAADRPIRILFVGGDWKSQLPGDPADAKNPPMRGYFVKGVVDREAPGKFEFTFWTSYEFLQYGSVESLSPYDVLVAGDVYGQSAMPRLIDAVDGFVRNGGGLWYPDNHKAYSFNTQDRSFDAVMPYEFVAFRPMGELPGEAPSKGQPLLLPGKDGPPIGFKVVAADHPITKAVDLSTFAPFKAAHTGKPKSGAVVLLATPDGQPLWTTIEAGKGRTIVTGGFFANDEQSIDFAASPAIGKLYVSLFTWLAEHSAAVNPKPAENAAALASLTVDLSKKLPALSARHFSIHGQEDVSKGSAAEQKLYADLNPDGAFARFDFAVARPGSGPVNGYPAVPPNTPADKIDLTAYKTDTATAALAQIKKINAVPIGLFWIPWNRESAAYGKQFVDYFRAALVVANGIPGTPAYQPNVQYFEPGNEPNTEGSFPQYLEYLNVVGAAIHKEFPGVKVGCWGSYEWPYVLPVIEKAGANVDWVSRHPYGQTGEAIFEQHDRLHAFAKAHGQEHLKSIITEWDFWVYGEPAFDYLMQRWKPMADRADDCLGTLQYRWNEYQEGGYCFGVRGVFKPGDNYGRLPPEWPHPGQDMPITYRYDAFWLMRDCRGEQYGVTLDVPALKNDPAQRAYGIATCDGGKFNIVLYYGYPYQDTAKGQAYRSIKVHLKTAIPPGVKGRSLRIARGDARAIHQDPPQQLSGDQFETDIEVPALSGVSLTIE